MARKAISARKRFEIFKRDGFTCQYCGSPPPDVILHLDHINPVAMGGGNNDDNLITSCDRCNRGKGAVPLTAVPMSLSKKAEEVAEREAQIAGYAAVMEERRQRIESDAWRVAEDLTPGASNGYSRDRLNGILHFVGRLPVHEVLEASSIARSKFPWSDAKAFKYFCGICWRKIRDAQE